ncbi:alpha/beta hydrolase [Kutzneria sp. CA-103260]|uniref:alpha/beta hydrolase n=1 Tax=Kutzneria sp. CA-103260 TaxID=2802641 RepID=UPI001BAB99A2|nr:alpha/beta hydrolase [Kutzneria sp. CA-103260]QUQ65942.1 Esterase FrsA [Kutzneria sp. CA-103260]
MTARAQGQAWALDAAIAQGGFDALHPQARGIMEEFGVDHTDFDKVFSQVRSGAMMPKAWADVAAQTERRAAHHQAGGFQHTAEGLYARAALLWGHANYTIRDVADPRKAAFRQRVNRCVDEAGVRRVRLPFGDGHLHGLLHLPAGPVRNAPAVILGPGMDMIKEDFIAIARKHYTSRGIVALSVDGPGQGETRETGVVLGLSTVEQALSRFVDFLSELDEVDPARIGMFGISMSGYWGHRLAATDRRLAALASFEGVTGDFTTIFERAQPSFKANFMAMAGYDDESAFDRELAAGLPLGDLVADVECPVLIGIGEFDELSRLDQVVESYEKIRAPKEIRVYENEFHPLGGVAGEVIGYAADWLSRALSGELAEPGRDARFYMRASGRVDTGSALPTWWSARD